METEVTRLQLKQLTPTQLGAAVFLSSGQKTILIYVDTNMGEALNHAVMGTPNDRPSSHDLMLTLLDGLGAEVERVVINDVVDQTFYARLILSMENEVAHKVVEIDARPSDALALAFASSKPVFIANELLDRLDDSGPLLDSILDQDR